MKAETDEQKRQTRMDAEIKRKWIEALQSGKYQQCTRALCDREEAPTQYCCLGVLWDLEGRPDNLTALWAKHVGMNKGRLIKMNDDQGRSFAEIADYIEQNL